MILVAHEFFDLFLTTFKLVHNLLVALFDSQAVIALAVTAVLEGFLSCSFSVFVLAKLLLVEASHLGSSVFVFLRSCLD